VHVILNPTAGAGRARRLQSRILSKLAARFGPHYTLYVTQRPGDATASATAAVAAGATLVVAVGGDGTIHEIVNGLLRAEAYRDARCHLGIVDCGTGSGLAQSLALPATLDAQLDLLTLPHSIAIDVGHVVCHDEYGRPMERWLASECQVGIGGVVVAGVRPSLKRFGGSIAFGAVALREILRYRATSLTVSYSGNGSTTLPLLGLVIGNGSVCAGGMRLTPSARLDDGLFDVLAIHDMGVLARLRSFPRVYAGRHVRSPRFSLQRSRHLTVSAEPPAPVSTDGEFLGFTPCRVTLLPSALRIRSDRSSRS
jgi:YegS/Rv2252/BmrU family lipid kinase